MLCGVMPVEAGKRVCTTCWQLAPAWIKRSFMKGERVEWSRLLEPGSNAPITTKREEKRGN